MEKKDRQKWDADLFKRPPGTSSKRRSDSFDDALESAAVAYLQTLARQQQAIDS